MKEQKWFPLRSLTVEQCRPANGPGYVYCLRDSRTKTVLYVGCTANILRRLFGNYLGGVGGCTTKRIHGLLFKEDWIRVVEVSFKAVRDYAAAERKLIQKIHPPWNLR